MSGTPQEISPYDLLAQGAAIGASSAFIDATQNGVSVLADDNSPALQDIINALDSQGANIVLPTPASASYRFKQPVWLNKQFTNIFGLGQLGPAVSFDLRAYVGALPKHGFILASDPAAMPGAPLQGCSLESLRIDVIGGVSGVYAQRACATALRRLVITGAGLTHGIRQIAGDSWFRIQECSIGQAGAAAAPSIGVSVENGANQTLIEKSSVAGLSECVRTFNSLGLRILNNDNLAVIVTGAGTHYIVRIMTDQVVPAWLTWALANETGGAIRVKDNWFEPGDFAGATVHDVYVGSGAVPVGQHPTVDFEAEGNEHFGTTNATRVPYVLENVDGAYVRPGYIAGTFTNAVWVKAEALNYVVDAKRASRFNTNLLGSYVRDDAGTGLVFDDLNDNLGSANYRAMHGSLLMALGSGINLQDRLNTNAVVLNNETDTLRIQEAFPAYANNAAALAAGEFVGNTFRNTTTDTLAVVH